MLAVVKLGGGDDLDTEAVCRDIAEIVRGGDEVVLVHGGAAEIARLAGRLAVPQRRLTAPDGVTTRYTDAATLEVVTLALAGGVKPRLVAALGSAGVRAAGLTGLDGGLARARRKSGVRAVVDGRTVVVRDVFVGRITEVDPTLPRILLESGHVPVVSPPVPAEDGTPVNADADRLAAGLAMALKASALVLLTAAPGVLADPGDERSVLGEVGLPADGPPGAFAGGGMALKLVAAREALEGGVPTVLIGDGRTGRPVHRILAGDGTRVALRGEAPASGRSRA